VSTSRTLLILEDNETLRSAMVELLSHHGFECHCAATPEAAVALVDSLNGRIHAVLADIVTQDGEYGGVGVVRAIQTSPATSHVPVIVQTAIGDIDLAEVRDVIGDCLVIRKPFDMSVLLSILDGLHPTGPMGQ
jgi:DNA-binding NtrC family response regulator